MNEFDFIRRLREQTESRKGPPRLIKGIGDDASVMREIGNRELVITTDLLVEGTDFYRDATPPRLLGHKALAVSLSDIAAMGARPRWAMVAIGMPAEIWRDDFKESFFAGYFALADQYGVALVGGDISESKAQVVIDSIVIGEVSTGEAVLRSTARPGDHIFVTGNLGGAAAGLKLIEMGARVGQGLEPGVVATESVRDAESAAIEAVLLRQLRPHPRTGWGIVLGEEHLATAMIDISDGLSSDLAHVCSESKAGAIIQSASIPIDADVQTLCGRRALDPLALALDGGEDFELLFTVSRESVARLPKRVDGVAISQIGEIVSETGVRLAEKNRVWELEPKGFEHFKNTDRPT